MNRRVMLSTLFASTATAALASTASARGQLWCEEDPLVVIKTPTGYQLPVHITAFAEGAENQVYLDRIPENQAQSNAWISWTVAQSKKGGPKPASATSTAVQWDVTVNVAVQTDPGDGKHFRTRAIASSDLNATGVRYDDRYGIANHVMELRFSLWA